MKQLIGQNYLEEFILKTRLRKEVSNLLQCLPSTTKTTEEFITNRLQTVYGRHS